MTNITKTRQNKYHRMLVKILEKGKIQKNKKGDIQYLLNETLVLKPIDLLEIFEGHGMARKKLKDELNLFMAGERSTEAYREAGVTWWDYCGPILVNSYPTYFEQLPRLIEKINREKRNSKNYVLFLGQTNAESNQQPCLSLIQFQIEKGKLIVSAYQRSSDASLGLPADIYHLYLISKQIDVQLKSITLFLGNVHIYQNNIEGTKELLAGGSTKFTLNV
ncbi:MAG: thymidylate synthase [Aequorivita sp.]|nr:thymidylate synthase [Aequorivita sp.]MBP42341.1 thymidylate synthase [Aequorivita sp.]|tara:strand:+ start:2222 stop:2881 length:660 start_codon:yes stop_codon:yes gene_type:complete